MGGESRYVCRKNNNNKVIAFFLCWQPPPDSGVHPSVRDEEAEESDRDISRVYCRAPRSRTKRGRPLEMQAAAVDASGCCVSVTRSGDYTLKDIYTWPIWRLMVNFCWLPHLSVGVAAHAAPRLIRFGSCFSLAKLKHFVAVRAGIPTRTVVCAAL